MTLRIALPPCAARVWPCVASRTGAAGPERLGAGGHSRVREGPDLHRRRTAPEHEPTQVEIAPGAASA